MEVSRHPVRTYQCVRSSREGPKAKSWSASFVGKRHVVRVRTPSGDWHLWPWATLNNALIGTAEFFGRGVDISRYIPAGIHCMLVAGRERESEGSRLKKSTFLRSNNLLRLPKLLHVDILSFITVIFCKHSSFEKTAVIVPMLVTDSCAGRGE